MTRNPGNALIVSTHRLGQIAGLSCLDVLMAVCMPQRFVCSEVKCTHRWEPTGHQMTCCGVVAWSALGRRLRGERGKRGERRHCAPDAMQKFTQSCCHDDLARSTLSYRDSDHKQRATDVPVFFFSMLYCCPNYLS